MKLHILTIASRFHLLNEVWNSIKIHEDIVWHIGKSKNRILDVEMPIDNRIKIYNIPVEDTDTGGKMNYLFNIAKEFNGYFCILDDDTLFSDEMYFVFKKYVSSKVGMIIGKQIDKNGVTRLQPTLPVECAIDTGNVLCKNNVLNYVRWGDKHWDSNYHVDFDFWDRVYKFYGIKRVDIIMNPISIYNALSNIKDSLDYIRE